MININIFFSGNLDDLANLRQKYGIQKSLFALEWQDAFFPHDDSWEKIQKF